MAFTFLIPTQSSQGNGIDVTSIFSSSLNSTKRQLVDVVNCQVDAECDPPFTLCISNECQHKDLFPIYEAEFLGFLVLPALVGMANVGGIGGGGLTVPLVMVCWGFTKKQSIAISGASIFFGSVVRYFYSLNRRHPEKKATNIDYGVVLVMLPIVLLGSYIGVLFCIMIPTIYLSFILTSILLFLSFQSLLSALSILKREKLTTGTQGSNEQPLISRTRSEQILNPIEEYSRDRIEREIYVPDIRYIH